MKLAYHTRGGANPQGKPRVYLTGHPADLPACSQEIIHDILNTQNCAIYYDAEPDAPFDREELLQTLEGMQLLVIPVTGRFLHQPNRAREMEFQFAMERHIPVLPLAQARGLEADFNQLCGDLQMLQRDDPDPTALPYGEKLEKFLSSVLVGDELAQKVRSAFDAYIFLSYRKKDRRYAQRLMRLIHQNEFCRDIAIWYDEFLTPGEDFNQAIADAMRRCDLFALAVTPNILEPENYVMRLEYPKAREAGKVILPVELAPTDREALQSSFRALPPCTDAYNGPALSAALLEAVRRLAAREHNGDPRHNFFIGLAYLKGIDMEVDRERALALITGAAEDGLPEAMEKLVSMYRNGDGAARDYRAAIGWQRRWVDLCRRRAAETGAPEDAYQLTLQLWVLGDYLMELPDPEGALDPYGESLRRCQEMIQAGKKAQTQLERGSEGGLPAEEERARLLAQAAWARMGAQAAVIQPDCFDNLGDAYAALNQLENAGKCYQSSLAVNQEAFRAEDSQTNRHNLVISLQRLGDLAKRTGDLSRAGGYYRQAEALLQTGVQRQDALVVYSKLGDCALQNGDLEKAEEYYQKQYQLARALFEELQTACAREQLAYSCGRMFELCLRGGRPAQAERYALEDLEHAEALDRSLRSWTSLRAVGIACEHLGIVYEADLPERAERCYSRCLSIRRELCGRGQTPQGLEDLATICGMFGQFLADNGRFDEAKACGMELYDTAQALGSQREMNSALILLFQAALGWRGRAEQLIRDGQNEAALEELQKARETGGYIKSTGRDVCAADGSVVNLRLLAAVIQTSLANAHSNLGDYERAVQAGSRAGEIYEEVWRNTGDPAAGHNAAACRNFLGARHLERGRLELASLCCRKGMELRWALFDQTQDAGHLPVLGEDCLRLGEISFRQEKWEEAGGYFRQSARFLRQHYESAQDVNDVSLLRLDMQYLGHVCWELKDLAGAKLHYETAMDCAVFLGRETGFRLPPAEAADICHPLGMIAESQGNWADAVKYYRICYDQRRQLLEESASDLNQDNFACISLELGIKTGNKALVEEACALWGRLSDRYPHVAEYARRQSVAQAKLALMGDG